MSDVKPKRPARPSKQSEISPGEPTSTPTTATIIPQDLPAPEIASALPEPSLEPVAEIVSAPTASLAPPVLEIVSPVTEPSADSGDDPWAPFAEAQAALARGLEEIVVEVGSITRSGIAAAADAALALLAVRTLSDAVEINALLAYRGVDSVIEGSAKLSEIGVKAVSQASRPILLRFGEPWGALASG